MRGWETAERLLESGGYESRQRALVDRPIAEESEAGARWLGVAYWHAVGRVMRGTVRASWSQHGGTLRVLGGAALLGFGPPELHVEPGAIACRYAIRGGLLALRAGGSVTLAQVALDDAYELSVVVEEYLPRLAGVAYAKAQSPVHAAVSRRYFEQLERAGATR